MQIETGLRPLKDKKGAPMILWTKKISLATFVLFSVAAMASLAQSQTCGQESPYAASDFSSQYVDVGQPGSYFEQAATCGCQQSGCNCGGQSAGLLTIARALRPFGDSSCFESYRTLFGGWNELDDYNDAAVGTFNDGFVLGTAKGIYVNSNTRIERENTWRNNSGNEWTNNGVTTPFDGRVNNFSTMLNVIREFQPISRVTPYVGIGAGASRQDGEFVVNGNNLELDDWAFAYQGIAGLRFQKSCNVSLFAEYRYFGNSETDLENPNFVNPAGNFEYTAQNVVFGIQFKR